jgi:molybdate transport system substrate-binding protein
MKNPIWIFVGLLGLVLTLGLWGLSRNKRAVTQSKPLVVYCAAANRAAMDAIIQRYQAEYGREVQVEFGASQTLLSRCELARNGDLFVPADDSYLDMAAEKNIVAERIPIASMKFVLVVPKGNPKAIRSLQDVYDSGHRLVQADPDASAIGNAVKVKYTADGTWDKLKAATKAFRGTVTDVANDVKISAADVGIVYDAVIATYPQLEAVQVPELEDLISQVEVGVLSSTQDSQAALHFARYITAHDRGLQEFEKRGFRVQDGDTWADRPEISLFAGSMLRPAIEETLKRFQEREGVQVTTVFNGCGILVGQMKTGQRPDAYFACDVEFMNQVTDLFPEPVKVSQNELVIIVPKGNPKGIASLKDLSKPDLRVGIGHEKQCAMGWITQVTFKEGGVQQEVMKNVTVQAPTGDMLVNQMRAGSLDAAVVYLSNAAGAQEELDAIQIQGLACSTAIQPWAVYKESKYSQTASRLFQAIVSPEGQADFAAEGFGWQLSSEN